MKKIIFLDLDGTLWTFEKIPSSALEAIELARKNGHKIYINTGRTRCEVPQFLLDMNLDGYCFGAGSEIIIDNIQVLFKPLKKRNPVQNGICTGKSESGTPYRNRTDDQFLGGICYIHLTKGATMLL